MNYGLKEPLKYLDWEHVNIVKRLDVIAVDQAKFNLTWLAFPEVETHGLEFVPESYVDNLHEYMDRTTRFHLGAMPLSFMRYWQECDEQGGLMLAQAMPEGYNATMLMQAHKAQARLVLREGNLITPTFWGKAA